MAVSRKQIKAERRRRRELVERARRAEERTGRRQQLLVLGSLALALAAFVGAFAVITFARTDLAPSQKHASDVGRRAPDKYSFGYPDLGNQHIASADSPHIPYNSDPPTSGPHLPNLAPDGWHDVAVPVELLVHNLEDGHIVVYYRPDLDPGEKAQLKALVAELGAKVTAAPYGRLSSPIALTAWTRLDELSEFDPQRIRDFVTAYRGIDHHRGST
ncbi:MAG: DUF3105 domain-containing protein [Chloroflexota bacterium]|nr:DUF3105 domain-containing protein [Chloroflexota bacterium]